MPQTSKQFVDLQSLIAEVYVIGYPTCGESIILLIKDKNKVNTLFSCVIDCYESNGKNVTNEILEKEGIKNLSFFIWTHTDEDHSKGIPKIISDNCSTNTQYILPEFIHGDIEDFVNYNSDIKQAFEIINSKNNGSNYCVHSASVVAGGCSTIYKTFFSDSNIGSELVFEILALSPASALLRRRWDNGSLKKKNELSIATLFSIGELKLFFSSDIEDQTIRMFEDHYFENLNYIKTPHHTSDSSEVMLEIMNRVNLDKKLIAVTTVFSQFNLPKDNVVIEYKKLADKFYSTGTGDLDSGVMKIEYDILNRIITNITLQGNAIEL